jgi:ferredoxin
VTGPANPARRAFLTGRTARPATRPGPALPWLADVLSAETCGPCDGPCVAACPEGIVARLSPEDPTGGVAWLDFRAGACTLCGACT